MNEHNGIEVHKKVVIIFILSRNQFSLEREHSNEGDERVSNADPITHYIPKKTFSLKPHKSHWTNSSIVISIQKSLLFFAEGNKITSHWSWSPHQQENVLNVRGFSLLSSILALLDYSCLFEWNIHKLLHMFKLRREKKGKFCIQL